MSAVELHRIELAENMARFYRLDVQPSLFGWSAVYEWGRIGRPGQVQLALFETDALLHRLLACGPRLLTEPTIEWDDLIEGYRIRNIDLGFVVTARPVGQARA